jgi:uncharacterized membrane protein
MMERIVSSVAHAICSRDALFAILAAFACAALLWWPTGFEGRLPQGMETAKGVVEKADNSRVIQIGLVRDGAQRLNVRIVGGIHDGKVVEAQNLFNGKLELDAFFQVGDQAFLNLSTDGDTIVSARAVDHYRLDFELWLFVGFAALLVAFAGWTGARALISFVFTALVIWRVLVPLYLTGYDPVMAGAAVTAVLTAVIVLLVGGIGRKGFVAFAGSAMGLACALALSMLLSGPFNLNGAVRPFSETLLYSGFHSLDLRGIFIAGIFIASSGAMMDVAMDLAAAIHELAKHRPDLGRWALFRSGVAIGRAVTGTMTTTLLLAYSGGYVTMMMFFMGRGVPPANCLNLSYVSSEIMHTLVGSFALVATAPFTAAVAALVFGRRADATEAVARAVPPAELPPLASDNRLGFN